MIVICANWAAITLALEIEPVKEGKAPGSMVRRSGRRTARAPRIKAYLGGRTWMKIRVAVVQTIAVLNTIGGKRLGTLLTFTIMFI